MKFLKKLTCAAAVAVSVAGSANAGVVINDWRFNPNGGGFDSALNIEEYLDVNGQSFIQLTPTGGRSFSFVEHAVFNIVQADGSSPLFPIAYAGGNISAIFEGHGNGSLGIAGGAKGSFAFSGGSIEIWQNPTNNQYGSTENYFGANVGNRIAKFDVLAGGGGEVDASGSPVKNGQVSVFVHADAGALAPGYFFRGNGDDLSLEPILAFAFTNANTISNSGISKNLVSEVACQYAGFQGAGCNGTPYANAPGSYFFVSNNGQFKLAEVAEPGSLALFGIAMLGAGIVSRKRARKA